MTTLKDLFDVDGLEDFLTVSSKIRRRRIYELRLARSEGELIKIVSEGDSWFQFPFFLRDVIDQLNEEDNFVIFSLGTPGDRMGDFIKQNEYLPAILEENADFFLISGGGNDLVGSSKIRERVHPFDPARAAQDYPNEKFDAAVEDIMKVYTKIFDDISTATSHTQVICHGYDYLVPNKQRYLGKPYQDLGIEDQELQQAITNEIIDRYNESLKSVADLFPQVHHLDLRGTLSKNDWFDENHPWDWGFDKLSKKFVEKINRLHSA